MTLDELESEILKLGGESYAALYGIGIHPIERMDAFGDPFGIPEALAAIREEQYRAWKTIDEVRRLRALVNALKKHAASDIAEGWICMPIAEWETSMSYASANNESK